MTVDPLAVDVGEHVDTKLSEGRDDLVDDRPELDDHLTVLGLERFAALALEHGKNLRVRASVCLFPERCELIRLHELKRNVVDDTREAVGDCWRGECRLRWECLGQSRVEVHGVDERIRDARRDRFLDHGILGKRRDGRNVLICVKHSVVQPHCEYRERSQDPDENNEDSTQDPAPPRGHDSAPSEDNTSRAMLFRHRAACYPDSEHQSTAACTVRKSARRQLVATSGVVVRRRLVRTEAHVTLAQAAARRRARPPGLGSGAISIVSSSRDGVIAWP